MFEKFSERARRIIFEAWVCAGDRGANSIQVVDVVVGFVRVDQGGSGRAATPQRRPYLTAEQYQSLLSELDAMELLRHLNNISAHATPQPHNKQLPLAVEVKLLLGAANALSADLGHTRIKPLHLLAATFRTDSSSVIAELVAAGVTESNVLARLRQQK